MWERFEELGGGGWAFVVDDAPQVAAGRVAVVGEAVQRRVGERVRAKDD